MQTKTPTTRLFDSFDRTDIGTRTTANMYGFVNASAWASVARIREFWEDWFSQYDEIRKRKFAARFRSDDPHEHLSAFVELFAFACLKRGGYALQTEPPAGDRALEFIASRGSEPPFYVECTATGGSEGDIFDALQSGEIHYFNPSEEPRRLRTRIRNKANRYGKLDRPLLLLASSTGVQHERELSRALLGDHRIEVDRLTMRASLQGEPNGIFRDARGPRNTKLSGIMQGKIDVVNFTTEAMLIVHHPFAALPLAPGLFPFCTERYFDADGDHVIAPSMSLAKFFGLPVGWPFFDGDPE